MAKHRSYPGIGVHTNGVARNRDQTRRRDKPSSINRYRYILLTGQRGDHVRHPVALIHGIERAAPMAALDRS